MFLLVILFVYIFFLVSFYSDICKLLLLFSVQQTLRTRWLFLSKCEMTSNLLLISGHGINPLRETWFSGIFGRNAEPREETLVQILDFISGARRIYQINIKFIKFKWFISPFAPPSKHFFHQNFFSHCRRIHSQKIKWLMLIQFYFIFASHL